MKIRSFTHKGLKRLYSEDSVKAVPPDAAEKLRKMLAFLDDMQNAQELHALSAWKAHTLTGDRKGHVEPQRYEKSPFNFPRRRSGA